MIWLLGTDKIADYPMTFIRQSRIMLDMFYEESGYNKLYNFVSASNELHLNWLRWLGFRISNEPIKFNNVPFYYFERDR